MGRGNGFLAVDLGAESGRVMLGSLADGRLQIAELHRFANGPTREGDTLRWDFARIVAEVERGLSIGAQKAGDDIAGISVNSWGVDFGLLDERGRLIADPYHYRDRQTDGMFEEAFRRVPKRELYERTGIQFMQLNTLYQLLAMRLRNDPALAQARRLVFMADLVAHALCGEVFSEYTLCSTSQLMDMRTGAWSPELLSRLDLPMGILPPVVKPGTVVGKLTAETARDCGCRRVPVIAGASHDTAAAVAAAPALGGSAALTAGEDWAYLSSGTWSLVGIELEKPVITDASFEYDVTNEGGVEGTIRFLKNTAGLWLVQESRRQWQREGSDFSYAQLTEMARQARPFAARLEPDHGDFVPPGDMPARINAHLAHTGQKPLADKGQIVRSILESLAFAYRRTLDKIQTMTGRNIRVLHIFGGGSQNELLNQFAADATGREVIAGPVEATSIGNLLMQAKAVGRLGSLAEIRTVVRNSFPTRRYVPADVEAWERNMSS